MKFIRLSVPVATIFASFLFLSNAHAQYKGARDYTNRRVPGAPAPGSANSATPGGNNAGGGSANSGAAANNAQTAKPDPAKPKFKEIEVNGQFFFLADTNRTYAWQKLNATTAKNTKNGAVAPVNAELEVRR